MSTSPTQTIDKQVNQITADTLRRVSDGQADSRELAVALEANQRYIEYIDWLKDNISAGTSVTVLVDEQAVKFDDTNALAEWLAERNYD